MPELAYQPIHPSTGALRQPGGCATLTFHNTVLFHCAFKSLYPSRTYALPISRSSCINFTREWLRVDEFSIMSPAGPHFQSRGSVEGHNVIQGLTTGDSTTINLINGGKDEASQNEKEACLCTLGFLEIDSREQDISAAVEHTCEWLFDTPEFKKWRDDIDLPAHNRVLCIKGKPGAGKSTLMRHTLEYCQTNFSDHLIVAYFFNARGSTLEKTPLGMLRSIVYQLIKKDIAVLDQFLVRYRNKQIISKGREWEWQRKELKDFIISVIKEGKSKSLLILVDALDECDDPDRQDVVDFLESLSTYAIKYSTTLKICLSRRHQPALIIRKCLEITVEENKGHQEDIAKYIRAELPQRNDQIEAEINEKAGGIFMWVVLVILRLKQAYIKGDGEVDAMRKALERVPNKLEKLFEDLLNKDHPEIAKTILMLQWVLFSQRLLEFEELFFAVKIGTSPAGIEPWNRSNDTDDTIKRRIDYLSKGLIEIRQGGATTVQFIHLSVNDFLLRNKRLQTLDQALEPDSVSASHHRLWACCWSHIEQVSSIRTKESYEELHRKYPFLRRAANSIFDHAEKVLAEEGVGQAGAEIEKWLRDASGWFEWWKGFLNGTHTSNEHGYLVRNMDAGILYMLSIRGYGSLAKCILVKAGAEINAQGGEYGNALQAASCNGKQQIVELLLKAGAEINAQGGHYGNALQAASCNGNQQIVELLLKAGAEINAQGGEYGNALQAASYEGNQQIVELLLKAGAEINAQGGEFGNALQAASCDGKQQIVELLLKAGAEINAQGGYYGNALQAASWRGSQQIVELLLKAGAEINAQGGYYGNALQAASYEGNQQIVELLLKAGAEINAQGGEFGNALQAASCDGKQQIVELLLKADAEINAQGGRYGNALQAASWQGKQQIVELLLKAGAEINAQGGYFGNALQAASCDGKQQIVELLLKADAEINAQGGRYGNALQAASYEGKQQIVELLLKASAEINAQGGYYGNALQAASWRGNQQIVELLLKAGADINAQGGYYGNALHAALHQKHHGIANMLREAGAIAIARHTESEVTNAGGADTECVSVEKNHDGASLEAAPAMISPSTEAPPPKIWFPLRVQGIYASPRLTLLCPGLFFVATGGVILWLVRGRRMASVFFGGTWRNHI
ncbi:ankyrin repeat-containing domain protein [Phaeosphaeriaceae sp. PMI808]|nr:ankyrin repeat-containing domain protein [Phaeosphaeriaceae sp. PMI808]